MGEYSNFADCERKNKGKVSDTGAYCGYIKHQIEGGKKKEEALGNRYEHEAYHLEEDIRKEEVGPRGGVARQSVERDKTCPICGKEMQPLGDDPFLLWCSNCDVEPRKDEARRPSTREKHMAQNLGYSGKEFSGIEGAPEPELERAKVDFLSTLKATIDTMTLMAKDTDWPNNPNSKVFPTTPVSVDVKQQMADVFVKQAKGFNVETNWFNASLEELQDIVKSANKFFEEAGWNSKFVTTEYKKHAKKWGRDFD
jgi:hypothetical protein